LLYYSCNHGLTQQTYPENDATEDAHRCIFWKRKFNLLHE